MSIVSIGVAKVGGGSLGDNRGGSNGYTSGQPIPPNRKKSRPVSRAIDHFERAHGPTVYELARACRTAAA